MSDGYRDGSGVLWAHGSKRSKIGPFKSFVVVPVLAWFLVPPFSTLHLIIWVAILVVMDTRNLGLLDVIGKTKLVLTRGKKRFARRWRIQKRNL